MKHFLRKNFSPFRHINLDKYNKYVKTLQGGYFVSKGYAFLPSREDRVIMGLFAPLPPGGAGKEAIPRNTPSGCLSISLYYNKLRVSKKRQRDRKKE
jgi:hypothetical protein